MKRLVLNSFDIIEQSTNASYALAKAKKMN